ncbi:MAG: hypothetical protein K0Q48_2644 [Bacillota bacterium]|nr:hypothetical protein [Bacillota bacterium]
MLQDDTALSAYLFSITHAFRHEALAFSHEALAFSHEAPAFSF